MNTVIEQIYVLVMMVVVGWMGGVFFDCYRVIRYQRCLKRSGTLIGDLLYCLLFTAFFLWCIFNINHGELRSYVYLGSIIGFVIYFKWCHRFLWRPLKCGINLFYKMIHYSCWVVALPWRILKKVCSVPWLAIKKIGLKMPKMRRKTADESVDDKNISD